MRRREATHRARSARQRTKNSLTYQHAVLASREELAVVGAPRGEAGEGEEVPDGRARRQRSVDVRLLAQARDQEERERVDRKRLPMGAQGKKPVRGTGVLSRR